MLEIQATEIQELKDKANDNKEKAKVVEAKADDQKKWDLFKKEMGNVAFKDEEVVRMILKNKYDSKFLKNDEGSYNKEGIKQIAESFRTNYQDQLTNKVDKLNQGTAKGEQKGTDTDAARKDRYRKAFTGIA